MALVFGGQGVLPSTRGQASQVYGLQAGMTWTVPAGAWSVRAGRYCSVQRFDPVTGIWRTQGGDYPDASMIQVNSDGNNWRVANQTGCAVGALITNAGTGYTSAPVVTASAGASVWQAIVGGAMATSATVSNGGASYVYPPIVEISAPPAPGIQATARCTISAGAVATIVVIDQGAGYVGGAPTITLLNDPRDSTGYGASAVATLTGAGTITGLLCTDHGNPVTSIPTLTFTGGGGASAAATTIWQVSITGYDPSAGAGNGYGATGSVEISGVDHFPTTAAAYLNPSTQSLLVHPRKASLIPTMSGAAFTSTVAVLDGGIYSAVPYLQVISNTPPTTVATLTFTVGGQNDIFQAYPA